MTAAYVNHGVKGGFTMVREGPAEPSEPNLADTPEGRQARPYGMLFTAAAVTVAIVIVAAFLVR